MSLKRNGAAAGWASPGAAASAGKATRAGVTAGTGFRR